MLLLSAQLYGCSDRVPDKDKEVVTLPASESHVAEESGTREAEMPAEVPQAEISAVITETDHDPVSATSAADTEDMSEGSESIASQPEEGMGADSGFYRAATSITAADVERYAVQVRQQFLARDWPAVASELSYPITISDVTYDNSEAFLEASGSFDDNLADDFFTALEEEDCKEMFCNYQGIMLGETGQVCKWALKLKGIRFHNPV